VIEYPLILVSLLFLAAGQLLQKLAAVRAAEQPRDTHFLARVLRRPETMWAIASLATGTVFWLAVLYRMEVSKAFPFLSLGLVLVMLISRYYLRENISPTRWLGVALIALGIVLVSTT